MCTEQEGQVIYAESFEKPLMNEIINLWKVDVKRSANSPENYAISLSSTTAMLEYSTLLRIIITILELALGKWRNMTNPKVEVNCL